MLNIAQRIVTRRTLTVDARVDVPNLQHPYSSYGIGLSLILVPFVLLQRSIAPHGQAIETLANPALLAATGAAIVLIANRLRWHPVAGVAAALAFGVCTPALWESTDGFSEPAVALLGLLVWRARERTGSLLVGGALGVAILCRPDSVVTIAPWIVVGAVLIVPRDQLLSVPALRRFGGAIGLALALQLWYDDYRY